MKFRELLRILKKRLLPLEFDESELLSFSDRIQSSVVVPFFEREEDPWLLFMRKREGDRYHGGQVSFPGGRRENTDPDLLSTALREFEEETGISRSQLVLIGRLELVPTKSTPFVILPFVGFIRGSFNPAPDKSEVARIFAVPFRFIESLFPFDYKNYTYKGKIFRTPLIEYDGETIWGATARILELLIKRIRGIS